jgi:hypothetical protein
MRNNELAVRRGRSETRQSEAHARPFVRIVRWRHAQILQQDRPLPIVSIEVAIHDLAQSMSNAPRGPYRFRHAPGLPKFVCRQS